MTDTTSIIDQAIAWHLRQRDMADSEWRDFIVWLETDPAHARAFDAVALDQAMLVENATIFHSAPTEPANDNIAAPARKRWWAAGGVAAAAAIAVALVPSMLRPASDLYTVTTRPGEQRNVALAGGSRIEMNGGSRVTLDRNNSRFAALDDGEATFHVQHDAANPFVLRSGSISVQDLGTVFNVVRDGKRLDVEVAEGAVLFQPGREAVTVKAGSALTAREDLGRVTTAAIDVARVGGWRTRALTFRGEPVAQVAAALRRLNGAILVLDPALSARPFTGMLQLTGEAKRDVPRIAALIGAKWRQDGERWVLSPLDGSQR